MTLDAEAKKWLQTRFRENVKFDEPMSRHTSLRVGGPAEAFITPLTLEDLRAIICWARQREVPCLAVGDGTNLLVKDGGIAGIIIVLSKGLNRISITDRKVDHVIVTAMAGARLHKLCTFAITHSLKGMNFALGIPGTVGGGIMMNAGTSHGWMQNVLEAITILDPEKDSLKIIEKHQLNFSYRKLSFRGACQEQFIRQPVIVDGSFCLRPFDKKKLEEDAETILASRRLSQPTNLPSAGCFFKNPGAAKTAGELIELAGLKGKKMGGAEISDKHANFIVNSGGASATDILRLMDAARNAVLKMFQIDLEPEVKIVGK